MIRTLNEVSRGMMVYEHGREPPPYQLSLPPEHTSPVIFNSPHSGRYYPPAFLSSSRLSQSAIRRSEDFLVDELFAVVVDKGSPLLQANFPRAFIDVNREPYELDPKMFAESLPPFANVRSIRVAGGLGTIARVVSDSEEIYREPLSVAEAMQRIEKVYRPYHAALRDLLARTHARFGYAVLIDCHSMPSCLRRHGSRLRPDFVLGDRYGTSCSRQLVDTAFGLLRDLGYTVCRNKPYAGGFITEHYGRPTRSLHALQIEINRALYMDEERLIRLDGFAKLARDVETLVDALIGLDVEGFAIERDAAE